MDSSTQIWPLLGLFALVWPTVLFLLGFVSGWRGLASRYRANDKFVGKLWRMQSGQLGWVNLRNVLSIGANQEGLYLAMMIPFRLGHAPLFIPWSDITVSPKKVWFRDGMEYRLGGPAGPALWISVDLAERVRQASQG